MKILVNDTDMEATNVRFKPDSNGEPWTEYLLEDGTVIRFRSTMMSIVRVSNTWTPSGEPVYQWQHQTSTVVVSPDHLKQPVEQEKAVVQ